MIKITTLASSSKGNCYKIDDGNTPLLLECGISFKDIQRGLDFKLSEIAGVLITHEHKDHCKSVADMMKAGIDIYASDGTIEALNLSGHRVVSIQAKKQFTIGTWTILPFDVAHDVSEPLGFLLKNAIGEKLIFITDTAYCRYTFTGLTHIMLEVNYCEKILDDNILSGRVPVEMKKRLLKSHFSLENAKKFLKANDLSKVEAIHLLHLSDNNSNEALFKREIQQISGKPVFICKR